LIRLRLEHLPAPAQWLLLAALSAVFAALLHLARLPAAFFLGPMAAGVIAGIAGGTVRVSRIPFAGAQGIIGCLIASGMTPAIFQSLLDDWPVILGVIVSILAAASLLGWSMTRSRIFPATTSIWGVWPGGASVMVIMAAEFGADARLVAFMQYFRVVCVAGLASAVASVSAGRAGAAVPEIHWLAPVHWHAFGPTLLLAAGGAAAGRMSRLPSGPMIVTLLIGAILHLSGVMEIELPRWLLTGTYALLGWSVGLNFTPAILAHALRAFPKVLVNVVILISFSAGVGYILTQTLGIDILTAYLATSPGGLDSVAIIAASSHVDVPFVMALQTIRFLTIVIAGPPLARFLARRADAEARMQPLSTNSAGE
jgi:membrane AbrB-like protein